MRPEAARLKRLQRLEQVRAIAKQSAALEAARAEGTLAQLEALAERTRRMAEDYRGRTTPRDGLDLRQLGSFVAGLDAISHTTTNDAAKAQRIADARQQDLAQAERRRAAAEDRARSEQRALSQAATPLVLGGRKPVGTGLE